MSEGDRIDALKVKHQELESAIENQEKQAVPDDITIHDLKKQKLRIKDELLSLGAV